MKFAFLFCISCIAFSALSTAAQADTYCVSKAGALAYLSSAENSKKALTPLLYTPLQSTGREAFRGKGKDKIKLLEVTDMSTQKFWISRKFVSKKLNCVAVQARKAYLRTGPGKNYPLAKIKSAEKYEAFIDLGGEDGWTQVRGANGDKAWITLDAVWKPKSRMRISFEGE